MNRFTVVSALTILGFGCTEASSGTKNTAGTEDFDSVSETETSTELDRDSSSDSESDGSEPSTDCAVDTALSERVVVTKFGAVQGVLSNLVTVFKGIPYAAPPVDALRFRQPVFPSCYDGVLNAEDFGPACPQLVSNTGSALTADFGAFHGLELLFVFGHLDIAGNSPSEDQAVLSSMMMTYWANLAAFGSPSSAAVPDWPPYDPDLDNTLILESGAVEMQNEIRKTECDFWDDLASLASRFN